MRKALIVEDIQNDFMPGGGFPVPKGDEVLKPINELIEFTRKNNWLVVFSRDWHPTGMDHCVENSKGAKFHPDLNIAEKDIIVSKGKDTTERHFSTFNGDDISLLKLLKENSIGEVFIAGLAMEYCVLHTAFDSVKYGFSTSVIIDACKSASQDGIKENKVLIKMKKLGIKIVYSNELIKGK